MNVCPLIVKVPVRAAPVFAVYEYPSVPFPVPLPGAVTVNHPAFELALHAVPAGVTVTPTDPVPAPALTETDPGVSTIVPPPVVTVARNVAFAPRFVVTIAKLM